MVAVVSCSVVNAFSVVSVVDRLEIVLPVVLAVAKGLAVLTKVK